MAHAHHSDRGKAKYPAQPSAHPGRTHAHPVTLEFDFVVAERAKYIPNSGPPLAPIGILPLHDKEGVIEDVISVEGNARYIVSYKHKPALRMSVKAENVRDYVSARTLEEWEWKHTQIRNELEHERFDPKAKAKRSKEGKLLERKDAKEARESPPPPKKIGRPFGTTRKNHGDGPAIARRSSTTTMGPGAGMGLGMLSATSPQSNRGQLRESSFISPRRPSTSTPSKQRGLAEAVCSEIESEEEEEETSAALDRQLNGTPIQLLPNSKLSRQNSLSEIESSRVHTSINSISIASKRSRTITGSVNTDSSAIAAGHDHKRRKISDLKDSVASISSRAALETFEQLENRKREKANSITDQYSKPVPRNLSANPYPLKPLEPPKPTKMTKAQANKAKTDVKFGMGTAIRDKSAPATPPRPRESRSSSRKSQDNLAPRRSERTTPERPSSRNQDTPAYRRSERGSSRASVTYTLPPSLKVKDLEPNRSDFEPEYEVEAIVGEKWRTISGQKVLFYLIRWHGDYQNTWEPATNVGMGSVKEWEKDKRQLERIRHMRSKAKATSKEDQDEGESNSFPMETPPTLTRVYSPVPNSDEESDEI